MSWLCHDCNSKLYHNLKLCHDYNLKLCRNHNHNLKLCHDYNLNHGCGHCGCGEFVIQQRVLIMYVEGYLENNEPSHPHTHITIPSMVATCIVEDFFSNCVRALDLHDLMNSGCYVCTFAECTQSQPSLANRLRQTLGTYVMSNRRTSWSSGCMPTLQCN